MPVKEALKMAKKKLKKAKKLSATRTLIHPNPNPMT